MRNERRFRTANVPPQIFEHCQLVLEEIDVEITGKEILKNEGDNFDGILEGTRPSDTGDVTIQLKVHGYRDMNHHAGFWATARTTELTVDTFEVRNGAELPDTPNAKALNKEFNKRLNLYVWHTSG